MTDQFTNASVDAQQKASAATEGTPGDGVREKADAGTDRVLSTLDGVARRVFTNGKSVLDGVFPPEKRAAFFAQLQDFMVRNPKWSAFLGMHLALTGIPLGLFVLFSLSVFIFALVVALIAGLLAAVLFTVVVASIALFFVLPTVMFTTAAACFLFLWGLGGYYLLKWANGDRRSGRSQESGNDSIGQRLDTLSGGRLGGFIESVDSQNAKN